MIDLLIKKCVKDRENTGSLKVRAKVGKVLGYVGIVLNTLLFVVKFLIGMLVNSISIQADAINNLTDAGSNIVSILSFRLAEKPADQGHPYGHERTELITSMLVGIAIAILGFETAKDSVHRIFHPEAIDFKWSAVIVLVLSILVKLWMYLYNTRYGRKYDSTLLLANAMDSKSDTIGTFGVLLATLLSPVLHFQLDGYMGLIVSGIIFYSAYDLLRDVMSALLGQAPDPKMIHTLSNEILECPVVISVHDVLIHSYGPNQNYATAHAVVDGRLSLIDVHSHIDQVERRIKEKTGINVSIHVDPVLLDDRQTQQYHAIFDEMIDALGNHQWEIHDFRIDPHKDHVDVFFDLVVPYAETRSEEELTRLVRDHVKCPGPVQLFIEIDHPIGF